MDISSEHAEERRFFAALGGGEPEWRYEVENFSAVSGVVSGNIISTRCSGRFEGSIVTGFVGAFESYFVSRFPRGSRYFVHVDLEHVANVDRITRGVYLSTLVDWHSRYPFESYIVSGAGSSLLRAAFYLARPFVSFPIHMVKAATDVLPLVEQIRMRHDHGLPVQEKDMTGKSVEDLLAFMGSLDWHERGWHQPPEGAAKGPLAPIYDALLLIKDTMDEVMETEQVEQKYRLALAALQEDLNRLRLADQARREFVEDAFHDIRTPLTLLHLQLENLNSKAKQAGHSILAEHSINLNENISRLSDRLSELLEYTRLEARQGLNDPQHFNWPELTHDVAQSLTPFAKERNIEIKVRNSCKLPPVFGDVSLVDRATENLITNAIRHSPEDTTVDIELGTGTRCVRMQVRDRGTGVSENDIPKVFERFYGTGTRVSGSGGTGLGLAIVRRIAELHGGEVSVKNDPAGGAVFSLTLPIVEIPSD